MKFTQNHLKTPTYIETRLVFVNKLYIVLNYWPKSAKKWFFSKNKKHPNLRYILEFEFLVKFDAKNRYLTHFLSKNVYNQLVLYIQKLQH